MIELVERFEVHFTTENIAVDPPRKDLEDLIVHVLSGRHGEDIVELFQSALLGLGNEEEDHDQCNYVETTGGCISMV